MQKTEKLIKNYIEEKLRSHSQGLLVDKMNAHAFSDDGNGGVIAGVEIMCNWVNLCDHRTIQNGFPINFKQSDKTNFSTFTTRSRSIAICQLVHFFYFFMKNEKLVNKSSKLKKTYFKTAKITIFKSVIT